MSEQLAIDFDAASLEAAPSLEGLTGDLLGDGVGVIGWTFRCMEWAEDAIAEAQERHPQRASLIDASFRVLCPRYELFGSRGVEHTVRAHMDELLNRIGEGGPDAEVVPATAAECCAVLAEISLTAPLKHRHHMAYIALFTEAFGEEGAAELIGDEPIRRAQMDKGDHLIGDIMDEVRHQVRDEDRGEAWAEVVDAWSVEEAA